MSRINGIAEGASGEQTLMERIISWRKQYITDRQFTLFLSFLVGFFAAGVRTAVRRFGAVRSAALGGRFGRAMYPAVS